MIMKLNRNLQRRPLGILLTIKIPPLKTCKDLRTRVLPEALFTMGVGNE